jgi:hypothetical protein
VNSKKPVEHSNSIVILAKTQSGSWFISGIHPTEKVINRVFPGISVRTINASAPGWTDEAIRTICQMRPFLLAAESGDCEDSLLELNRAYEAVQFACVAKDAMLNFSGLFHTAVMLCEKNTPRANKFVLAGVLIPENINVSVLRCENHRSLTEPEAFSLVLMSSPDEAMRNAVGRCELALNNRHREGLICLAMKHAHSHDKARTEAVRIFNVSKKVAESCRFLAIVFGLNPDMARNVAFPGRSDVPLLNAVNERDMELALRMLGCGADIQVTDNEGNGVLHHTALCVSKFQGGWSLFGPQMVKTLIERGANPNAVNNRGESPLKLLRGDILSCRDAIDELRAAGLH